MFASSKPNKDNEILPKDRSQFDWRPVIEVRAKIDLSQVGGPAEALGGFFRNAVAMSPSVWSDITSQIANPNWQGEDVDTRSYDVRWMAASAALMNPDEPEIEFEVALPIPGRGEYQRYLLVALNSGEAGKPMPIIMQCDER